MRPVLASALLFALTSAATAQVTGYGGLPGPHASFCLARIDDRGIVHLRHLAGSQQPARELLVPKRDATGKTVGFDKVIVTVQTVDEQTTSLHASAVQLFGQDGQPRDAKTLPTLLKQERPVVVFQGKPDAKYLSGFKKDIVVLALPKLAVGAAALPPPR